MSAADGHWKRALTALYIATDERVAKDVNEAVRGHVAKLEAELADYKNSAEQALSETCNPGELHCSCVPFLRARIAELEAKS